jgi:hypothetical protein
MEAAATRADRIYGETVKPLPPSERYKLAARILSDIDPRSVVDYSDEWTDEDIEDFRKASWHYINQRLHEEDSGA